MRRQQQGRPELGRSSPAGVSCWGLQSARAPPGLPAPSSEAPAKTHIRRRSFGAKWFGRHDDNAAADPSAQPSAQPQAPNSHGLEAALFDLNLDDERSPSAGGFAGKGSSGGSRKCASPAHAAGTPPPLHRRRWSFGRQVMPQPVQTDAAEAAAEVDGRGGDDLLVTASSSVTSSSARSSPQHPAAALAQQQQQQQQQGAPATPPQARGPSYRRLWNSITSVRKGDPLPAHASGPSSDVTVESLVKAVQRLKPGQPVMDAVRDGLSRLDSRATAALLKELSKGGLPHRAAELFDWLRSLPGDDPLARLADLYTYTTIISQCGSHQQLRRALELVGEMRSRGIEANIHTYSALMSVCVKCNECELALDVFRQLRAEGLAPNLVTYNILIDIHGKAGQWAKAVEVLSALAAQGCTPEARTYNTIISACAKAGQPEAARGVYERMLVDGVQPTGTTYTSLISAYGKAGQVEEAVRIYQDMSARGCERNVITYGSLFSAAERGGRCDIALQLFEEMRREGCRPNVVTFNGLIGACAQGGMWAKAAEAFDSMAASGVRPDAVTFSVLISAYERGGQWRRCLQAFERMQQQGFRPDACVYNAVLDALVGSGLVAGQAKAAQLAAAAHRQGHLRLTALSPHEATASAYSCGAAFMVVLRWLGELREAPPAGAMPLAFAAAAAGAHLGAAPHPVSLTLTRGKHCRGDHSFAPVQRSLADCFAAFSAPIAVELRGNSVSLQADALALTAWLSSPSATALLSPLDAAAPGATPVPSAALLADDVAADMQCSKAFAAVLEFEAAHPVSGAALAGTTRAAALRARLAADVLSLSHTLGVQEETALDAVQLCDWVLSSGVTLEEGLAPLYAASMLLLCCRQSGEASQVLANEAVLVQLTSLPLSTVLEAEAHLSAVLGGDTGAVSALRVLQLYLERLGCSLMALQKCQLLEVMALSAVALVRKAALSPVLAGFRPSLVAAACLYKARGGLGLAPAWPRTLQSMTAYQPGEGGQLAACLDALSLAA
ncbi:Pentatricopeptide repeat-containing [Micractinium conductrix]|uniref:Pentatricopeptide repeat-containing n=1 Tax=Micractinium conductrix TaxID=554055 RepID=A0A2P6VSH5_9CHLO|nr:Pentatricopeptide repeat-containing [Micractinium conductrix]|eukprot:PSC77032.1 Pentatricopeptide repeat-containing [Micractinium conductrix]